MSCRPDTLTDNTTQTWREGTCEDPQGLVGPPLRETLHGPDTIGVLTVLPRATSSVLPSSLVRDTLRDLCCGPRPSLPPPVASPRILHRSLPQSFTIPFISRLGWVWIRTTGCCLSPSTRVLLDTRRQRPFLAQTPPKRLSRHKRHTEGSGGQNTHVV